eukprot:766683-Hanusia_phi.AAC.7
MNGDMSGFSRHVDVQGVILTHFDWKMTRVEAEDGGHWMLEEGGRGGEGKEMEDATERMGEDESREKERVWKRTVSQ